MRDKILGIGKIVVMITIFAIVGILGVIAVAFLPSILACAALVLLVCRLVKRYIVRSIYFKLIATGEHVGHAYVDMGSSIMWATCNVGASNPSAYGGRYVLSETETKSSHDVDSCETYEKIGDKYNWGGNWRLPTKAEFEELCNEANFTWTWGDLDGHKGYKVKSKKNGNWIFLPAADYHLDTVVDHDSPWNPTNFMSSIHYACGPYFRSSGQRYSVLDICGTCYRVPLKDGWYGNYCCLSLDEDDTRFVYQLALDSVSRHVGRYGRGDRIMFRPVVAQEESAVERNKKRRGKGSSQRQPKMGVRRLLFFPVLLLLGLFPSSTVKQEQSIV